MMVEIGVRVLGPLEIAVDGLVRTVTAPKQRALLAVLLVAEGRPVAPERLVEELWPEDPPATATAALQVHVSGLRKVVGARLERPRPGTGSTPMWSFSINTAFP